MGRKLVPMSELKRVVISEIDRRLGARGTVRDVFIARDPGGGPEDWTITEIDSDGDANALRAAASEALPDLHREYGIGR
jgi:hypothetical protein